MGDLTTFTIYNDGIHLILEDSDSFCKKLYDAAGRREGRTFGHGPHRNLVKVQQPRHDNDSTIYVHMGNTVCEMSLYSKETEELMKESPDFFKKMLDYMEKEANELKTRFAEKSQPQNI